MPAERVLEDLDVAATEYAVQFRDADPAERAALRDEFAAFCLPFATRMARRYRGRGEAIEDLVQVARLGLIKAIDRYDPERGSFTAYGVITISGELKRHFRDRTWGVHVPRRLQDLCLEVGLTSRVMTAELSRTPTPEEIAERLRIPVSEVSEAIASAGGYTPASLNAPALGADSPVELGDLLGVTDAQLEAVDDKLTVAGLLLRIPARERQMLAMRFYGNHTQAEIAAELGISQMHVSRLLSRALTWLRQAMLSDTPPRWEGILDDTSGLHVSTARAGDRLTVHVRGEVDRDTADRLRLSLRQAVSAADAGRVVIDLSAVPLLDAAGVAVLFDAASAASVAGVGLSLAGAQPQVAHILAVTGLRDLLATG